MSLWRSLLEICPVALLRPKAFIVHHGRPHWSRGVGENLVLSAGAHIRAGGAGRARMDQWDQHPCRHPRGVMASDCGSLGMFSGRNGILGALQIRVKWKS